MGAFFVFFGVVSVSRFLFFLYIVLGNFTHDVLREVRIQRHQNTSLVVGYHLLTGFKKSKKLLVQLSEHASIQLLGQSLRSIQPTNSSTFIHASS